MPEAYAMSIDEIVIGERRRQEYGDIEGLKESIEKYGLLHPIVIDENNHLVAGGRRLEAFRRLGWTSIPVRNIGDLTEMETREVELEENLRRKDLTQLERDKVMLRLVETAREIAVEEAETCTESVQVSAPTPLFDGLGESQSEETTQTEKTRTNVAQVYRGSRGPAQTPGSLRDVSERTGIPVQTIRDAEQHVAAKERYPEIRNFPRPDAIAAAKNLDKLPEPQREEAREALRHHDPDTVTALTNRPPLPKGKTPQQIAAEDPGAAWLKGLHDLYQRLNSTRDQGGLEALAARWNKQQRVTYRADLARIREVVNEWEVWLEENPGDD